ncbi:MAG TPA: hypothetical protein DCL41_02160, partial [Bdellovibrionales bacterium]|nr:hypothetical protein [Bdellovibrionales bacterium]
QIFETGIARGLLLKNLKNREGDARYQQRSQACEKILEFSKIWAVSLALNFRYIAPHGRNDCS